MLRNFLYISHFLNEERPRTVFPDPFLSVTEIPNIASSECD